MNTATITVAGQRLLTDSKLTKGREAGRITDGEIPAMQGKWRFSLRYGSAVAGVALALGLRLLLDPILGTQVQFLTFLLSIALVAWFAGRGPAILAVGLSVLAIDYFLFAPRYALGGNGAAGFTALVLFVCASAAVILAAELRGTHLAYRQMEAHNQALLALKERLEQEIGERQQAEAERNELLQRLEIERDRLAASEERFRLATEATNGIVYDWDRITGLTWRSTKMVEIVGYRPEETPTANDWWRSLIHPDDLKTADPTLIADDTPLRSVEYRVRHKDGHYLWVWDTARIVRGPAGQAVRVIGCTVSVNERKQAEEKLKALNDTLEQQVIERTSIAEQRASQLRILASELVQAEERERRRLAKVLHDHLQQLLVAARFKMSAVRRRVADANLVRSLQQADDMLNQAVEESRSLAVELSPPVLYEAGLGAALEWLARQIEEQHGLRVEVVAAPAAEPADETTRAFLFQAVRELLLNVVKHAHADCARVELASLDDGWVRLVVADAGVGIAPAASEHLRTGDGLGLFSIRERLEVLGGRFTLGPNPGGGTRVVIEVAAGRADLAPAAREPATPRLGIPEAALAPSVSGEGPQRKTRVMLADDHPVLRQGLAGLLREHCEIDVVGEAADGQQAVEVALRTHPDVVLMDITMPVLNGIEATRRILDAIPSTRVIGLSMHAEADMATAMRKAGAVAYLTKDAATESLVAAILDWP